MTSLKHQLFSGVFYTALAKYSGIGVSLVVAGVLARLISPDDFGVMAVATVIIAFFNLFTDVGLSPAIIQHKTLTGENLSGLFSFTVWTGIGLALLFAAASWPIAAYYDREILRPLCQLLAVNLFFASATIVPNALFYRNKEFKFIALRSFVIQIATGTAAVVAALCGAGLYALIIGPILSGILIFAVSIRRYPQRLKFTLGLDVLRRIFSYSAYQFLFNIINYFSRNLDKLLIGKYMGMSPLGYYEKSYRLMMLPLQNIAYVVSPVMHPIFSEMQNDLRKLAVPDAAKCPDELPPVQVGAAAAAVAQNFVHCRCHDGGVGVPVHKGGLWHGGFHRLAAVDKHHGRLGCCTQVRQALPIRVQDLQAGKGLFLRAQLRVTQGGDGIQHGAVVAADGKLLPAYRHAGGQLPAAHCCSGASPAVLPW